LEIITQILLKAYLLGGEVAIYCSHHFIEMLQETAEYKEGRISEALMSTFMEIDKKLRDPHVIKVLNHDSSNSSSLRAL